MVRDVEQLSTWSGWLDVAFIAAAGSLPLGYRAWLRRRAAPSSRPIDVHLALGLGAAAVALVHTVLVLTALGAPSVISSGMLALAPASVAFFLLFAHVGVGLRLRDPRLRDRAAKRRLHLALALSIVAMVAIHVVVLLRG